MSTLDPSDSRQDVPALIVGREREKARFRHHIAQAEAGTGRLLLVSGEAGIGKSAFVNAAAREATNLGFGVLRGSCYELTPPYGPWRELASYNNSRTGRPESLGFLARELASASRNQDEVFRELRDLLAATAAERPTLIVLEDLHWADPASLELLRFIARQLKAMPILMTGTLRGDELTRHDNLYALLPTLVRESGVDRINLRPLEEEDVRTLVAWRYRLSEADETRLVAYLRARGEGNPFFVGELLRALEDENIIRDEGSAWTLAGLGVERVPPLLRQVIDGRVARLGSEAREPLAVASVLGQEIDLDLWSGVLGYAEEALLPMLERAFNARILEPATARMGVRFSHALIREALYEAILPPRRRSWHVRIVETLAAALAVDADRVAHHFQQAGDARAVEWLVRAGESAQRMYAWVSAAERFAAAADLLAIEPARVPGTGVALVPERPTAAARGSRSRRDIVGGGRTSGQRGRRCCPGGVCLVRSRSSAGDGGGSGTGPARDVGWVRRAGYLACKGDIDRAGGVLGERCSACRRVSKVGERPCRKIQRLEFPPGHPCCMAVYGRPIR